MLVVDWAVAEGNLSTSLIVLAVIMFSLFFWGYVLGHRHKKRKSNIGEAAVRKLLVQHCRESTAYVMNDVTLPYADGSTQIDHILFTQNGILVIETKHYSGWIFANEFQKSWTQVIFKVKSRFQNPILQNNKHVNAVRMLLDFLPKEQIQGVVVFTGDAEFKTTVPDSVLDISELLTYADEMRLGEISENRLQFCVGRLQCSRFELSEKTDVEHQAYLDKKFGSLK